MSSSATAIVRLKFLISVACVRLCHHIETQYNRSYWGIRFLIRAPTMALDNSGSIVSSLFVGALVSCLVPVL